MARWLLLLTLIPGITRILPFGVAVLLAILLRGRIRGADLAAAKQGGDTYANITALARAAWVHRRSITDMTFAGRLLGMRSVRDRIEAVAAANNAKREEVWRLIASAHATASNTYPLPNQVG